MWNKVNSWGEKVVEETKEFAEKIEEKAVETYQKGQKYVAKKCKQAVSTIHKHVCTTTARIQKNIERVKVATEALAKSVTTWVSDHKEVLITGALIVGTAALVVATGGIGAACVPGLIMATAGGAVLGAGGDIVGQMISNQSMDLSKIDWGSVALSGLAGGATGLLSATGAGPVAMGIMGGVSSGASEIYHQMQSGEDINWGQVAVRTLGGAVSGAVLGNVGSQTASGAKEIAKNAGKVFLANGGVSFAENLTYNLIGGEDLGTAAKQASFSALISGGTSAGFYALGQAAKNMCFVEGTMVLTAEGLVAIECIAVGDMVIATDPETGETAEKEVKNTFVNETEELAHVFVDGEEIVCTPGHKFYAPERGWTSAIELRAGDQLQLVNGEYVTVEKVQHELLEEPVKVYNFEVEDFHTYYVGTEVQVLVHNMCSRKKAFNEAKRDANIPTSQQPSKVERVKMTEPDYAGGHTLLDKNGNVQYSREYHFVNNRGEETVIQDHSFGHTFDDGVGNQGSHFNVRPADDVRNGSVKGTKPHYDYDKKGD